MDKRSNNAQLASYQRPNQEHKPTDDLNNNHIPLAPYVGSSDGLINQSSSSKSQILNTRLLEIAYLNPKIINSWSIKGRCCVKTPKYYFDKLKGNGRCFSFILGDQSGSIKVTAFNQELDRFYPVVKPDKVYCIKGAKIQVSVRQPIKSRQLEINTAGPLEILLNSQSDMVEVVDFCAVAEIPKKQYDFVAIDQFKYMLPKRHVDLIGIVVSVSKTSSTDSNSIMVTIVDSSRNTINIKTRLDALDLAGLKGRVILAKGLSSSEFDGRSIVADIIEIDQNFIGTEKLKKWHRTWSDEDALQFTRRLILEESISNECLEKFNDISFIRKKRQYKCKATVIETLGGPIYRSCPSPWCWKKVEETDVAGEFCCMQCYKIYLDHGYRYKINFMISDFSSSGKVILWNKAAVPLLGLSPEELVILMNSDREKYRKLISRSLLKTYLFTLNASIKMYKESEYVHLEVEEVEPVEPVSFGRQLIARIQSLASS